MSRIKEIAILVPSASAVCPILVDVVQEIIMFTQNIYQAFLSAEPFLKRHYLAFFWERFEVEEGVIIKYHPSLLFKKLLEMEQVFYEAQKTKNPQLTGDSGNTDSGIIRNFWLHFVDRIRNHYLQKEEAVGPAHL